jgi:hypothetical protein
MVNIDPTNSDFIALSQPVELHVIASGQAPVPTTDDSSTTVGLGGPPFCGPGAIPFFGTNYTQMHIISNGPACMFALRTRPSRRRRRPR